MSFAFSRRKWTNLFRSSSRKQRRAAAAKPSLQMLHLEDRVTPAQVTISGGESSSWIISDTGTTDNGLPSGGTGTNGAAGTGATIGDASIPGQGDAFDFGGMVWVNDVQVKGALTQTGNQVDFAPSTIAGLNVAMHYFIASTSSTARVFVSLSNPTGSPIMVPVDYATNFGSDGATTIQASSNGNTSFEVTDRWLVTDDTTVGNDPANTTVLFGPGTPAVTPSNVSTTVFDLAGTQGALARYTITIGAGQTRSLMWFQQLNPTTATAIADAAAFFDVNPTFGSDLLGGLSPTQVLSVANFSLNADTLSADLVGTTLTIADLANNNNSFTVSVSGSDLVITDTTGTFPGGSSTYTIALASVSNLVINGSGGSDTLRTIGSIPVAIEFNGGTGTSDALRVSGTGLNATYTPSQTTFGSGTVAITGGQTITFTGLEPVDMDFVGGTVTVDTGAGTADLLTVENSFHTFNGTTPALKISGTANAVPIEAAYVSGAAVVILTNDGTDSVTVTSANNAHGNTSLNINAGTDAGDAITINGTTSVSGTTTLNAPTINLNANVTNAVTGTTATVVNVTPTGEIRDAIAVAASGATVNLSAGTFLSVGQVNVTKPLTFIGAGSTATILKRTGEATGTEDRAFEVQAPNVTFQHLSLAGWELAPSNANVGRGYLVWLEADSATFDNVLFEANDNRVAIYLGTRDFLTVTNSRFIGTLFRAGIRGGGEFMNISHNSFEESHYWYSPIYFEYGGATSGTIDHNYFANRVGVNNQVFGNFKDDGTGLYAITNFQPNTTTADGLFIVYNTFDFQDSNLVNQNGSQPIPTGVYIDPLLSPTGPIVIQDNIFRGYKYTGPQASTTPGWMPTGGVFGGALDFDGVDDFGVFQSPLFDVGTRGTLNFWVQMDDVGRRNQFFEGPGDAGFEAQYRTNSGGQFYARTTTIGGDFVIRSGGDSSALGVWTNIQIIYDFAGLPGADGGGKLRIYRDGVESTYLAGSTPTDLTWGAVVSTVNGLMNVGRDPGDQTRYFDGRMDDIGWFNNVLTATERNMIRTTGVAALAADSRLVAHWDFDQTTGSVAIDNKNAIPMTISVDGSLPAAQFGPQFLPSGGVFGGALDFDGLDDFATFNFGGNELGDNGTINFWVNMDDVSRRNQFIEGPGNGSFEVQFRTNSGGQIYTRPDTGGDFVIRSGPDGATLLGNWTNIQVIYDFAGLPAIDGGGKMRIFVNGAESSYLTNSTPTDLTWASVITTVNGIMSVGRDPGDASRFFNGRMDDLAWFNDVLPAADRNAIRLGSVGVLAGDPRLVAYWNLDDAVGTTVAPGDGGTTIDLFLQAPPPAPPRVGYAINASPTVVVDNNVFFDNDIDFNAAVTVGPNGNIFADPLFQGTGTMTNEIYALRFGSPALFQGTGFPTPDMRHIGAYQGEPVGKPITVYVNDEWTAANGFPDGTFILDADPALPGNQPAYVGDDAFADVAPALAALDSAGGTVVVWGNGATGVDGAYTSFTVSLPTQFRIVTDTNGENLVTFSGAISLDGQTFAVTLDDRNGVANLATTAGGTIDAIAGTPSLTVSTFTSGNGSVVLVGAVGGTGAVTSAIIATVSSADLTDLTATGSIAVTATGAIALGSLEGTTVDLTSTTGAITDANAGVTNVTAASLTASAATGIDLDTAIATLSASTTGIGSILIDELDDVTITAASTADGPIEIQSGGTMTVTSVTAGGANNVRLTTTVGDIALTFVSAAGDNVLLQAAGAITDGNGTANNVLASSLLTQSSTGTSLDTAIANLSASNTTSGDITIANTGNLTIDTVGPVFGVTQSGVSNTGGGVVVSTGKATSDSLLTVNAAVSASGGISLTTDQDFTSVAAGTISAGTSVVIEADVVADVDVVGATVSIGGAITAGTTTSITTSGDADSVTISAAINGTSASVSTADAADSIVVNTSGTAQLSLDGEAAGDSYTVNVGTLNAQVNVADSGPGAGDLLRVNGTAAANTFEVNTATGGNATVAVDTTQVVTYTNAIETLSLDGGDLGDTFNIFFAQGMGSFLPATVNIADTGATGTDVANVSGTDNADTIDVNFTATRTTTLGGESVRYVNGNLETLNVFSKAGNDLVFAKAVLNTGGPVVNLNGGSPSNPTPLPGDILVLDVTGMMGLSTANIKTPAGSVTSTSHNDLTWADFETIPTPIGLGGTFDFGTASSPVQAGPYVVPAPGKYWVGVANTDTYASKGYYGWTTPVNSTDRGAASPNPMLTTFHNVLRDSNWFGPLNVTGTFNVAAVAAGNYQVSVTIGDTAVVMDSIFVTIEGLADPIAVQKGLQGQFSTVTGIGSDANVDGKIAITIVDKAGTHSYWHVNAIDVRPVGLVSPVTITPVGGVGTKVADGLSTTSYTASGFFPNAIVTVSTTGGTITSADVDPFLLGVQVKASPAGVASFDLQHPTGNADVTLTANAAIVVDAKGTFTQSFTLTPSQKIDFNAATSPTEPGYLGVSNALYAGTASNGLGWQGPVSLGDRGAASGTALFRDFVFNLQGAANAGTFVIDLPTGAPHVITVYLGDPATARDRMQIEVADSAGTFAAVPLATEIRSLKTNSLSFTVTPYANGGTFQTRLRFSDLGGTQNGWSVQGIEYRTLASQGVLGVTPVAPVMGNGTAVTNYVITGGAVGGLVTLSSQFGAIQGMDASTLYDGFQVQLDMTGGGSFAIQSPVVAAGTLASAVGLVAVNGSHAATFTQQYTGAQVKYDFGSSVPANVATGFTYLSGSQIATAQNGVGFKAVAGEYDRNPATYPNVNLTADPALFRDAVSGTGSGTFRVLVGAGATNVPVKVYSYDAYSSRGPITVTPEGGTKQTLTPSMTTPAVYNVVGNDLNGDGFLDITIAGNAVWMMNGIEVG